MSHCRSFSFDMGTISTPDDAALAHSKCNWVGSNWDNWKSRQEDDELDVWTKGVRIEPPECADRRAYHNKMEKLGNAITMGPCIRSASAI